MRVSVVIPALNEEEAIGRVVREIPGYVNEVIVVDNGSSDATPEEAEKAGAKVVYEERRGYGYACLAGVRASSKPEVVVFLDGDYSDYPGEMDKLLKAILEEDCDLVIGSRMRMREPGAMPLHAVLANRFFAFLIRLLYGAGFTDLGPFRAIRHRRLLELDLREMRYGWTVEMQVKAVKRGFRIKEVPVRYRRRIGRSKVSGSLTASVKAALRILYVILRYRFA